MQLLAWNGGGIAELDKIFKPKNPSDSKKTTSQGPFTTDLIEELEVLVEGEVRAVFEKAKAAFEEL